MREGWVRRERMRTDGFKRKAGRLQGMVDAGGPGEGKEAHE